MKIAVTKNEKLENLIANYRPSDLISYYCVYQSESLRTGFDVDSIGEKVLAELVREAWHWDFSLEQFIKVSSPQSFSKCLRKNLSVTVHEPNGVLLSKFNELVADRRRLKQYDLRMRLGKLSDDVEAAKPNGLFEEDKIKMHMDRIAFIAENSAFLLRWRINEFGLYCISIAIKRDFESVMENICFRENVALEQVPSVYQLPVH